MVELLYVLAVHSKVYLLSLVRVIDMEAILLGTFKSDLQGVLFHVVLGHGGQVVSGLQLY